MKTKEGANISNASIGSSNTHVYCVTIESRWDDTIDTGHIASLRLGEVVVCVVGGGSECARAIVVQMYATRDCGLDELQSFVGRDWVGAIESKEEMCIVEILTKLGVSIYISMCYRKVIRFRVQ